MMFGLVALTLAFGLVFTVSAFKAEKKSAKQFTYWRYDLDQENGALNGFNYTQVFNPAEEGCSNDEEIPCVIEVEDSVQSQTDLNTYLNTMYTNDSEVIALAIYTKAELNR